MNRVIISYPEEEAKYIDSKIINYNISFKSKKNIRKIIYLEIDEIDYEKLLDLDYKHVIKFERSKGLKGIVTFLKKNINLIVVSIVIMMLLFCSNFLILKVNVNISDINIKRLVTYKLIDYDIHSYSLKKGKDYLTKIKNNILKEYKKDIEWIEITENGYTYNVDVIKRKSKKPYKTDDKCNYVAKKSGNIKSIKVRKGVLLVQENNYVKAGDILISGNVIYNDELKLETCASGYITGEVWYKVDLSYPLKIKKEVPSNKKHYNFSLKIFKKKYNLFKDKYNNKKPTHDIGNDYIGLNIYKTFKKEKKYIVLNEKEALKKAINKSRKNVLMKLPKSSKISSQNILKKYIKNDRIYIEVLITTEEEIGVVENYY